MPASDSEVLVGRHYLERGFLDAAMNLFVKNAELVATADWSRLAERLLDRNRIPDVVRVCELGAVPLPRERMLQSGDLALRRMLGTRYVRFQPASLGNATFAMDNASTSNLDALTSVAQQLVDEQAATIATASKPTATRVRILSPRLGGASP